MMPEVNQLALVVHTADAIVNVQIEGKSPATEWPVCSSAQSLLGESINEADEWLPIVQEEIQIACQLMLEG